jgi:dienelactone hydrolase/pimeloyl-ACP methyl ester carboxylesterase
MMQEWVVQQVRQAEARGNARRDALTSEADARAYVASVQERIGQVFGPRPEKTPLEARVTKKVERDAYTIEHILLESRPRFFVTGNLYLPKGQKAPVPGVVGVCGHSDNGKAAEAYQSFAQGLARQGYAVFVIDPAGQGERLQYLQEKGTSRFRPGVSEHIQTGNQQILVGEFLGSWFAWDGIRALDYLLTRPEVDPKHLGITGNSGGGTQTTWLCGWETRWTMAAPACFVTTFRRNAENELPADTEQCPPNALSLDLDHCDFLAAQAPKPVMILAKELDYFDARGAEESLSRLKRLYALFGRADQVQLHIGNSYHGYSQENREAMYRFFNGVTRASSMQQEPTLVVEKDEVLQVTESGQVHTDPSARTIFSFTREKALRLGETRKSLAAESLAARVRRVLQLRDDTGAPDYRILRGLGNRQYPSKGYCCYAVETEPGIHAIVTRLYDGQLMSRPPGEAPRAILYVSHRSADSEMRSEPLIRQLMEAQSSAAFYAMDVRGIGDSKPDICGADQFLREYGSDYFLSAQSLMVGRPYLGQKTQDVLRVVDWLKAHGHQEVHIAGRGWGALPAAMSALLHPNIKQVTLKNALASYQDIAVTEDYRWPYAAMLPNVLAHFDLPEVYAALSQKGLANIEPWGPLDGMKE